MRIECITAETDRYLPVLFFSEEDKLSEISETVGQDSNTAASTEESDTTVNEDEDTSISSLFRNDIYEDEYGDMVASKIQKMKKTTSLGKNPLKKNPTIEKQKPIFAEQSGIVSHSNVINHHFEINGFLVVESSKPQTIDGLKKLTYQIGENYLYTAPLLKEIRKTLCTPNTKGNRNICLKFDKTAGNFYHQFCNKMKQYGLFLKYFINGNVLTATISSVPKVVGYLNGQWLEMYAAFILEDAVSEYAKANGYDYEILTNVKVTNINSVHPYEHEIDCVISIGDKCFAFEMKSGGQFDDYSGLYRTRKELRFVPDRYLLLSTELDEDLAEVLQYFYEFYITGINNFKSRLVEMINKAFTN